MTIRVNGVEAGGKSCVTIRPAIVASFLGTTREQTGDCARPAHGELLRLAIPPEALERGESSGQLAMRLEVDDSLPGGLAIYGKRCGRYPFDPTLVFVPRTGWP